MKRWFLVLAIFLFSGMNVPTAEAQDYDDGDLFFLYTVREDTILEGISFESEDEYGFVPMWDYIHIQIGSKKYKSKLEYDGDFAVKIGKQHEGTVLKVQFSTKSGNMSKVRNITLKYDDYYDLWANDIFVSSTKIKGKYTGYMKGDKLTAKIGKKTYKATFTSSGNFTIKMPKQKAGTKVKLALYNSNGKKIESLTLKVYTTNSIKIGMTQKQVLATSWGEPSKKNKTISKYGNYEQWVYYWEDDSVDYLFFEDGKLTSIDSY